MSKPDPPARFWAHPLHLPAEAWAFLLLNLADLVLTNAIVNHRHEWGYESNPVARYWYGRWGLPGMVFLKFTLVAIVLVICRMIDTHRPAVARRLLTFCCIVVFLVVCYGLAMLVAYETAVPEQANAEGACGPCLDSDPGATSDNVSYVKFRVDGPLSGHIPACGPAPPSLPL